MVRLPLPSCRFALISECVDLTPAERAKLLETTELFASAHAAAANDGQSRMPEGGKTNEHFVAFVQAPDPTQPGKHRLIELDGRRSCPADLGECTDLLSVSLILRLARIPGLTCLKSKATATFVKNNYMSLTNSDTFSMIALGPPVPSWD